ncbi:MAG: CPBP family intramembrane metalloprotease [bacterium]|nr:CPBP family intramembrane metalloprotease [bacterium]
MWIAPGRFYAAALGAWNVVVNRLLPARFYVPANLGVAAVSYAVGRATGASNEELGTSTATARRGSRWGLVGAGLVAAGAGGASRHRATRHLFADQRAAEANTLFETLVRIPFGTVALEEVAFRSVLPELLHGPSRSGPSLRSSALFGLWHILPTLNALDINEVADPATRRRAVAGGVAVTAVAGVVLDLLRLRSRSLVAPMLVHWSANAVSYALAARRQAEASE